MGVRAATSNDLWEIAKIHKARFSKPGYLLGQYSIGLIREFYAQFLERTILLVDASPSGVDGFILGGESRLLGDCKRSFLRANALRCAFETVLRPHLWLASIQAVRAYGFPRRKPASPELASGSMRMLSFAIADGTGRGGTAMSLVEAFEARVRDLCTAYEGSVLRTNVQLLRFYDVVGFCRVGETGPYIVVRKSLVPTAV